MFELLLGRRKRMADIVEGLMQLFGDGLDPKIPHRDALFETFATYCVVSRYFTAFESDYNLDDMRAGEKGDLGIDGYAVLIGKQLYTDPADVREVVRDHAELDVHFVVVQAKRRPTFDSNVFTEVAGNLVHILNAGPLTLPHGPKVGRLHDCAAEILSHPNKFGSYGPPRLSFWNVSLGHFDELEDNKRRNEAKHLLRRTGRLGEIEVEGAGAHRLRALHHSAVSAEEATFAMPHHVEMPTMPGIDRAFLGVLAGRTVVEKILRDDYGNERPYLVEGNLRDYLSGAAAVNAKIKATLTSTDHRSQFAALNNGVTIVTRDLRYINPNFHVKDPQIVNGWQTCNVLREVLDESSDGLSDSVTVPVRIIMSRDEELIGMIVKASNTQTALTPEQIRSPDIFQAFLEDYFVRRGGPDGLRYERRLRQYHGQITRSRLITPRRLAQAYAAMWLDKPHLVTRYKGLMNDHGDKLFQTGDDPLLYYTAAFAWHKIAMLLGRSNETGIPGTYRPAQFHMLTGIKLIFCGEQVVPKSEDAVAGLCEPIIQFLGDPNFTARLASAMVDAIHESVGRESGLPGLGDAVRTEEFAMNFRRAVHDRRGALTSSDVVRQSRHRRKESSDV